MMGTVVKVAAWHFALTARADASPAGSAVVCLEARYLSVQWAGAPHIARRHVTSAQWREIAGIQALAPGALDGGCLVAALVTGDRGRSVIVSFTGVRTAETPIEQLAQTLDALLNAEVA